MLSEIFFSLRCLSPNGTGHKNITSPFYCDVFHWFFSSYSRFAFVGKLVVSPIKQCQTGDRFCVCVSVWMCRNLQAFFDAFKIWAPMKWHELHLDIDISIYKQIKRQRSSVLSRSVLLKRFLLYYIESRNSVAKIIIWHGKKNERRNVPKKQLFYIPLYIACTVIIFRKNRILEKKSFALNI